VRLYFLAQLLFDTSLTLLISNYALANFQDGLNAYNKQDYATALKEWQPLAKQGNADAQNNLGLMYNFSCFLLLAGSKIMYRSH
jgi:TPR repeat protein